MKTATIIRKPNLESGSRGPDTLYLVKLYKDNEYFGMVDTTAHSVHYAKDVVENWENGLLSESNEHIIKEEK